MERIEQARQALEEAKTALEYSVNSLDGVVSIDEEDEGEDGGSLACQACIKINRRAIAKIDAALSALEAEGGTVVKVKALVWEEDTYGNLRSETPVGVEFIQKWVEISDGGNVWFEYEGERFDTPEDAKAAAQADYERRIRSALEGGNHAE